MPIQLQELPLILCGPILRRVTTHSAAVFVALKSPGFIELCIHLGAEPANNPQYSHNQLNRPLIPTIPLGAHLHVALVQLDLTGTPGLFPGQLYGYNLWFRETNDAQAPAKDLAHEDIALINDPDHFIGCAKNKLPAFSLPPPDFEKFNLVHGSCRKPHGGGKDMLAALDDLLQNQPHSHPQMPDKTQYEDPDARPHLLLLTGDQIYADDVSPPLLRALHDTANTLLGWREEFEGTAFPGGFAATAQAFKNSVTEKNEVLSQLLETALNTGFNDTIYDQVLGLLAELKTEIETVVNTPLEKNWLKSVIYSLEYQSIKRHLEDFKAVHATWLNINRDDPAFMLNFLQDYYPRQKSLEGYLDFFLNLASDRHWGQIEVAEDPETFTGDPGESETAKRLYARSQLGKQPIVLSRISPPQRAKELKEFAAMTSDAMDAHLMFLGEFYMMYLFSWSDAVWPKDLPYYWESVPNYSLFGPLSRAALIETRAHTEAFRESLPKVRRVLANIPTLMIFDDHEVTDDWNLHEEWVMDVNRRDQPETNIFGAQLLRNALSAYAVFQDWGNRPEDYQPQTDPSKPENPGYAILEKLTYKIRNTETEARPAIVDTETGYSNEGLFEELGLGHYAYDADQQANTDAMIQSRRQDAGKKRWHWQYDPYAGTGNSFFILTALDTRTWRAFPAAAWTARYEHQLKEGFEIQEASYAGRTGPAALIHPEALTEQLSGLSDQLLNIVISPAPVFGLPLVEDGFQRYLGMSGSVEEADYESWQGNRDGFSKFREALAGKTVVLLSGDVHYAYSNYIQFPALQEDLESTTLVQLCSSSMKNETAMTESLGTAGRSGHLLEFIAKPFSISAVEWGKIIPTATEAVLGLSENFQNIAHFGDWFTETAPVLPHNDLSIIRYYLTFKDHSLFNFDLLLPNGTWELGSGIGSFLWNDFLTGELGGIYDRSEENVQYRILFQKDRQTLQYKKNQPAVNCEELQTAEQGWEQRLCELKRINKLSQDQILADELRGHWDEMREIVGFNNIARVSFRGEQVNDAAEMDNTRAGSVRHCLYWRPHQWGASLDLLSYTAHQIPLRQSPRIWAGFKAELIELAKREYEWWNPEGSPKVYEQLNGQKNPKADQRLQQYYQVAGLWAKYLTAEDPANLTWGAIFISYLVKLAGGSHRFHYSERIIDLMRAAKSNRGNTKNPFWLYDLPEYAPEPGDLICNWRDQPFSYTDIDPEGVMPRLAQCEVIIAREGNTLTTVGGNLSNSVGKRTLTVDADGRIASGTQADPDLPGAYIAIIKVRTNL